MFRWFRDFMDKAATYDPNVPGSYSKAAMRTLILSGVIACILLVVTGFLFTVLPGPFLVVSVLGVLFVTFYKVVRWAWS